MRIAFLDIQNFRKLRSVRIDLSEKQTIFVGANNSGKTSAMHALIKFLNVEEEETIGQKFTVEDFTLSLWDKINDIGKKWETFAPDTDKSPDFSLDDWADLLPSLDIWLDVNPHEYNYVYQLIPTLNWEGGLIGIRLRLQPKNNDLSLFFNDYRMYRQRCNENAAKAHELQESQIKAGGKDSSKHIEGAFWPINMKDFLQRRLSSYFTIRYYELDPAALKNKDFSDKPQPLPQHSFPKDGNPFASIIKVNVINAQRGFEDTDSANHQKLSKQLCSYFNTILNPEENPEPKEPDIKAALAVAESEHLFDKSLEDSFATPLEELGTLGYPGVFNPRIQVKTKIEQKNMLNHSAAVQYNLSDTAGTSTELFLPESYNGLGYQNLISMVFKLMRFRDQWMQPHSSKAKFTSPQPIHLVLVEEPEAHLHTQVQQVFIRKAHDILRKHEDLANNPRLSTQLIVSTHSSHIAHECEFADIRYFKRISASINQDVPQAQVVNLSTVFGMVDAPKEKAKKPSKGKAVKIPEQISDEVQKQTPDELQRIATQKFVARYLKTTHCDLFFADAVILIEGAGERILLPHFIKNYGTGHLSSCYLSVLEISGSHAFRLKGLLEILGLTTLIITDIDSVKLVPSEKKPNKPSWKKCLVSDDEALRTANNTLKSWIPCKQSIKELISLPEDAKIIATQTGAIIRVAYQKAIPVLLGSATDNIYPRTFEDAFILSNFDFFTEVSDSDEFSQFSKLKDQLTDIQSHDDLHHKLYEYVVDESFDKAAFALEILFGAAPEELTLPNYIQDGFQWLSERLEAECPNLKKIQCDDTTSFLEQDEVSQ